MRSPIVLALCGALLLSTAGPASATITRGTSPNQISLVSDAAADTITLACVGGQAQNGGVNLMPCNAVQDLYLTGNGGNDAINIANLTAADFPNLRLIQIDGGTGTDVITGSDLPETVIADDTDAINTAGGDDDITGGGQIDAGSGNDVIRNASGPANGGPGDDRFVDPFGLGPLTGGDGYDSFEWDVTAAAVPITFAVNDAGVTFSTTAGTQQVPWTSLERLDLTMGGDRQVVDASAFTGSLHLDGGPGDDKLVAGPGENFLTGGPGNDELQGGAGFDYVTGGPGNDTLRLRDGMADRALCGDGTDTVIADTADLLAGCELVDLPAAVLPGPAPQTPAPMIDVLAPKVTLARAKLAGKRLSFSVACPTGESHCRGTARLKVIGTRGGKSVSQALGSAPVAVAGGMTVTVSKTLTGRQLTALRRMHGTKLSVALTVADDAGNRATRTGTLRLTVPRR